MKRRQFVAGATTMGLAAQGRATAQGGRTQSYDALDTDALPSDVSIAWIVDRFVQVRSQNAPVVGADVTVPGYVLERATSAEEYGVLRDRFDWEDVDYTDSDAFSELFSAVAWPLAVDSVPADRFESYDLLWVTGIHSDYYGGIVDGGDSAVTTDRDFYDLYGHVPFVFALAPESDSVEPGTAVAISGTVEHTRSTDGELTAGTDGGYVLADSIDEIERLRTPDDDWSGSDRAEFTGLQHHPRPLLSSAATDVEYDDDLPRPKGGSLVWKAGSVETAQADPADDDRATEHVLTSDSHDVFVGETLHYSWDDDGDEDDDIVDTVNISLVVDTSGSMSERDTGWVEDGGEKSRLEAAQSSLREFFDLIVGGHRVSLVEFDNSASVVTDTTVVDDTSREAMQAEVDQLRDGGGTSIGAGMRRGMETIVDESGPKTMLLLSDGEENEPPYVDEVLPELRNRGIEVHTLGMGTAIDERQLEYIAAQTGAKAEIRADPGAIRDLYRELEVDSQQRSEIDTQEAEVDEGDTLEGDCSVDSSCNDVQFANTYEGSEMQLTVTDPDGNEVTESGEVSHRVGDAYEVWTIEDPPTGEWHYQLDVVQVDDPQTTTVRAHASSTVDADLFVTHDLYEQTGYVRFQLKVEEGFRRYVGADAHLEVTPPDGDPEDVEKISLYDEGGGPDDVSGDGIYSNYYHPTETGTYEVTAVVSGGEYPQLERSFPHTFEIDTVVDEPIRPFEKRSASSSIFDDPIKLAILGGLGAGAAWLFRSDDEDERTDVSSGLDPGTSAETDSATAAETDRGPDDPDRSSDAIDQEQTEEPADAAVQTVEREADESDPATEPSEPAPDRSDERDEEAEK
ncbi:VWA domain-containing protein [Halosolutus amylolyticus]|uniref:VWA domain-containing protein n=1 Tax=Halosolutus amylolyticus TaxID=2932267 RepID=A0ABD5PJE1_9EURY|nr:VWA domain-containing protein [Halosolutus amylolyticus]